MNPEEIAQILDVDLSDLLNTFSSLQAFECGVYPVEEFPEKVFNRSILDWLRQAKEAAVCQGISLEQASNQLYDNIFFAKVNRRMT
jgi:hypothetical protein